MTHAPVQIIYLNGPSSSGKTTLAKALQHAFEKPFLHVGIDKIDFFRNSTVAKIKRKAAKTRKCNFYKSSDFF